MVSRTSLLCAALGLAAVPPSHSAALPNLIPGVRASAAAFYQELPLAFEPNMGQAGPGVQFLARGPGYAIFLSPGEVAIQRRDGPYMRLRFGGANGSAKPAGRNPLPGRSNYFTGTSTRDWKTGVPRYARVHIEEVYPGIAVEFYGSPRNLEFDFVVAPGADPGRIRLVYDGLDGMETAPDGALILRTADCTVEQKRPGVFQEIRGVRHVVEAFYSRTSPNEVAVSVGPYDKRSELRIDPVLVYSSYLGGDTAVTGGSDYARAVAVDASGNVYVAGGTQSNAYPTTDGALSRTFGGSSDAFVTKFNASGTVQYSTYLGTSSADEAYAIAVDAGGNAYIAGYTDSTKVPVTTDAYQKTSRGGREGFVAKLAPDGRSLVYATYIGGSTTDEIRGLALAASGEVWVTGRTFSSDFPVTPNAPQTANAGAPDSFLSKLDANGRMLLFSTFGGGTAYDEGTAVAVDSAGNAYVTGYTWSTGFPVTANAYRKTVQFVDAFVTKFSSAGALVYSTLVGGYSSDYGLAIAVDAGGNAFVAGRTASNDLPVTYSATQMPAGAGPLQGSRLLQDVLASLKSGGFGGNEDGFVMVLNQDGSALLKGCYLGGEGRDSANAIALSASGDVYVTGDTQSKDFPVTADATQKTFAGGLSDGFLVRLNASDLGRTYSTFFGGSRDDAILAVAVDSSGKAHTAGSTSSMDFPATASLMPAGQRTAGTDAFVAKWQTDNPKPAYTILMGGGGGSTNEEALDIALDVAGNVYLTGRTFSTNFPVTSGAIQSAPGGGEQGDAFITKLDPQAKTLIYSTYFGGQNDDYGKAIAVDSSGAAYVVGYTMSSGLPKAVNLNGTYNTGSFVLKLNPQGDNIEYLSILGGNGTVIGYGISVDSSGSAYIAGTSRASNLPTTPQAAQGAYKGGDRDGFVAKLAPNGKSLAYCSYIGGSYSEDLYGLAVDRDGNAVVVGSTDSTDFPTTAGVLQPKSGGNVDAFAAKLNSTGTAWLYSTYLGGTSPDFARAVALGSTGAAYIAGTTSSTNFPTTAGSMLTGVGYNTGFVAALKSDASALMYSNRLADNPEFRDVAVDSAGNAYVTGLTQTSQFPLTDDAWQVGFGSPTDGFLLKLNPEGNKVLYATLLGGSGSDAGNAVAVDSAGNAYIAGQAGSANFPVTEGAYQMTLAGIRNAFLAKFDMNAASPVYDRPSISKIRNASEGADFIGPGLRIGPGAIINIDGEKLSDTASEAGAPDKPRTTPLPNGILDVKVYAGTYPLPLFSVSPTRIVAQMYYGVPEPAADVSVVRGAQRSKAFAVPILHSAPGIMVALKEDLTPISRQNRVKPGDIILLAVTGAGLTTPAITSGAPAPETPEYLVREQMTALLAPNPDTKPLECEIQKFALAPGYVGVALAKVRINPQANPSYTDWWIQLKTSFGEYSNGVLIFFPDIVNP
ncbi:MAG: SBBP repeat-containing protein [Bryobacteraceae bacterium]